MKFSPLTWLGTAAVLSTILSSCQQQQQSGSVGNFPAMSFRIDNTPPVHRTMGQMLREVRVDDNVMSKNSVQRRRSSPMKPTYITIHNTENPSGTADNHAKALNNGSMGTLNWHFTVDQYHAVRHLPLNETGQHADKRGPGDKMSIGIEMCEVRTHNPAATYDRTAKLTACLMQSQGIPLSHVVPHNYWTGKNCPHTLLEHGRPGYKWKWFISRVSYYHRCLNTPPPDRAQKKS